ncbi:AraC family transcriptional regulator [Clostridioides difficile]|uniref:AraC-family transcriptional regulator n=6 Tax=Clostridioides difficile TaxID=1496 RepID=A0A9R0BKU7_CLODR|nr:AraC family transcriptional regulator [Clostridioides difficile]OFT99659.1 AraC family transcriptional regulator [Clostridium sp. HMSC19E03]OFU19090.1 AraC family transcriptional regulator [Clostridium sp. HMSC19C09]OFU21587.1 AraC family transcriptional regulator [Clostridium sp. HMSC19C05]OFU21763.1 AraC family transcriptional regulator [Clostridium sp. HMSC19C08]OFU31546.1 AraC family transcriptional regulator [Clostridium sp. HMSC19B10]OFU38137.1 AraC family transcriptional regulator [
MLKKESIHFINKNRSLIVCEDNFVYLLPCMQLKNWISNFTISFPNQTIISDNYTIIPHGSVTLVFFYDATGLHSLLFGPTTKPKTVGNIANRCDVILIIEFQPAGFFPLIGIQQSELIDKVVPFSIINTSLDLEIKKIFNESLSIDKLILKLEELLISNIKIEYSYEFILAIQLIIQNSGNISSQEISKKVFYSSRHLNRLFNQYLGLSMKSFSRLVRINKSIKLLNNNKTSLMYICNELGFYDIPHFIKDFKIVCGITPQKYRANMSDFYSEIAKF